jgi:uncharacterized flavoprotein (TIGR03862 family)
MAAATAARAGNASIHLFEAKASVGRKFLVAGRGGLNLTHNEPALPFASRFRAPGAPSPFWETLITDLHPGRIRAWAARLGIGTFAAKNGRVYPREMKAAPLLRRWVASLRASGVHFHCHHRWTGLQSGPNGTYTLTFATPGGPVSLPADRVILALGGASWPQTGSDGTWTSCLSPHGIRIEPFQPANCGWEITWPPTLLAVEGLPLKNIQIRCGSEAVPGELVITRYGLEGGPLYQLGPLLRVQQPAVIHLNLKPDFTEDQLVAKLGTARTRFLDEAAIRWKLSPAARALLSTREPFASARDLASLTRNFELTLTGPRPLAEAISSAGGIAWEELSETLELRRLPGVFVAGEMIDWEAPTGGYLLHGCLATGWRAGSAAVNASGPPTEPI